MPNSVDTSSTQVNGTPKPTNTNGQPAESETMTTNAGIDIQKKYESERSKRLRSDGISQYIDVNWSTDPRLRRFNQDPWLDSRSETITLKDGDRIKYLILGAGFGGLLAGVKLVKAGADPNDVYTVDVAGGWGGTWYWNRYPGLMCDVASYAYLPLLEEMGYMPKHRYSYGPEIKNYIESIVQKYGLDKKAMFRTKIESADWDDNEKVWVVKLHKEREGGDALSMTVRTKFLNLASGVLVNVKLPDTPGLLDYKGHIFHTARWDYNYTGGSPTDATLTGLEGKKVGIIGTGATAVQIIPEVAKYAKELYVFQRTPSAVHKRDQKPIDQKWWQTNIQSPKWQQKYNTYLNNRMSGRDTPENPQFEDDGWTELTAYRTVIGGDPVRQDQIPEFLKKLHREDMPHAESVRARVDRVVEDADTASHLKAWYPSWCKRPCFHDDYLPTFNKSNVHLVDTDGKGVERFTPNGIIAQGEEHELDVVIVSTGFRAPSVGWHGARANMVVRGRDGKSFDDKWNEAVASLHGSMTHGFPNLFFFGPFQAGAAANFAYSLDLMTTHMAYIVTEAGKKAAAAGATESDHSWSVEPTKEAEEAWTGQILMRASSLAGSAGCTPSYLNGEGLMDQMPTEERMKIARASPWGHGIEDYRRVIEEWREEGKLEGLVVNTV